MIKNYLLITFRNFLRNKNYTLINVLGLSIGITSCIIIFLLINYELSFDKFNSKYNRIYRIVQESYSTSGTDYGSAIPYPIPVAFRNDFPDVPLATGMHYEEDVLMKIGTEKQRVYNILFADSLFFEVFDFKVLSGNPKVELGEPNKVFITKSLADKIMKGRDHLTIKIDNQMELEVVGIIADPPATSHIKFSMIVSLPSLTKEFMNGLSLDQWGMTVAGYTYLALPQGVSAASIDARLDTFLKKYEPQDEVRKRKYLLQPLSDVHFSKIYDENPGSTNADMNNLVMLGILGVFILAIACINFVNLATALAVKKSKEIGIRKTLGAKRGQLTMYFLGETFLIIAFSILISLCATEWTLGWINNFLDKSLQLNLLSNPIVIVFLLVLVGFSTFLSGFYPAIILSGFNPVAVLKNKISGQGSGSGVRKVLVVFQFTIAQVLIIGTLIVADQMNYFNNKPLGFNKEAIINVNISDNKKEFLESIKTRLDGVAGVEQVSISLGGPTSYNNFGTGAYLTERGKDDNFSISIKPVDRFYKDVYGLELKAGRWMTEAEERAMDTNLPNEQRSFVYIVNEAFVRKLGLANAEEMIGKHITTGLNDIEGEVIGVVGDFHVTSLHEEIEPTVLLSYPYFYYDAGIKIKSTDIQATVKQVEKIFNDIFPEYEFRYEFMDQHLAQQYRQDERTFTLFKIFSGVSIFIGCLGLYGLISFMANQKLKEVGIRKVLGASVESIVMLFGKEFIKLIVIAFIIAAPLTWYLMSEWLSGFAYRTNIEVLDFVIGIASTLLIALATVSYRSVRSAVVNPVEVLRTE